MTARQLDEATARLRQLRRDAVEQLSLAAVAFGLALAATQLLVPLALPLLAGGMAATALGIRAIVRRDFLLDDLAAERDAHVIAEVGSHARRRATREQREPRSPDQRLP